MLVHIDQEKLISEYWYSAAGVRKRSMEHVNVASVEVRKPFSNRIHSVKINQNFV